MVLTVGNVGVGDGCGNSDNVGSIGGGSLCGGGF